MASSANPSHSAAAALFSAARTNALPLAIPFVIGVAPVVTMALSWVPAHQDPTLFQLIAKGFALPVIAMELLVILAAVGHRGQSSIRISAAYRLAAAAFLVLMFGNALLAAANPAMSLVRTSLWIVHFAFACAVWRLRETPLLAPHRATTGVLAGFLLFSGLLVLFVATLPNLEEFNWLHGLPGLDNIRRGAYFAAPVAALCIGLFLPESSKYTGFVAATHVAAIAFIFWSGARGAALALLVTYILGAALLPSLRQARSLITTLMSTAAGVLLAWFCHIQTGYVGFWRVLLPAWSGGIDRPVEDISSGRTELWLSTWETIKQRPFLGHGEGQTAYAVPVGIEIDAFHPHNLILQVLLAWGVAGALLLLFLAAPLARNALACARQDENRVAPFLAMLALLIYSGVDGTLFHVHAVSLFALCAGLACRDPGAERKW